MAAPWIAGAQCRIHGTLHGQQTVNVLNFATNAAILDQAGLDTLLLQLAQAVGECVISTLLPAVSIDWKFTHTDAKRIYPVVSDPIVYTAAPDQIGELSTTSVSFSSSLLQVRTGGGGRKGRGRVFLPPAGEAEISQSAIDAPTAALLVAFAACLAGKFLGVGATTDWRFGVLSRKTAGPTLAAFDTGFRMATQLTPAVDVACMRSRRKGHGA